MAASIAVARRVGHETSVDDQGWAEGNIVVRLLGSTSPGVDVVGNWAPVVGLASGVKRRSGIGTSFVLGAGVTGDWGSVAAGAGAGVVGAVAAGVEVAGTVVVMGP